MSIVRGIALVTGSAQGIGRGIALRLAKDGFDIALNDVSSKRDQLRVVANDIEKLGQRTLLVPADVAVEREVKGMVQDVSKELGGLDVVSNRFCTLLKRVPEYLFKDGSERWHWWIVVLGLQQATLLGIPRFELSQRYLAAELEDWERIMAVNARGPFLCYKYAAQQMIKQGRGGRIIGAASAAGKLGGPLTSAYGASKFAVRGLTQSAGRSHISFSFSSLRFLTKPAMELGRYNITVNCYAPGVIETPLSKCLQAPQL